MFTISAPEAGMMSQSEMDQLLTYPQISFGTKAPARWTALCEALYTYRPPEFVCIFSVDRKWELVSAIQKSIRRGETELCLQLISAIDDMPAERPYFWRRLSVIACEDIGACDPVLTTFVVACSTIFKPKKTGQRLRWIMSFLAMEMCALPKRSRNCCSLAVIEQAMQNGNPPLNGPEDEAIITAIERRRSEFLHPNGAWQTWQRKNDWRGARLLRFLDVPLPFEMIETQSSVPSYNMISGLPSCCYDMYTRVGRATIKRLIRGVEGADKVRDFFAENKVVTPETAAGEALFFVEGGRIVGELACREVIDLEQRVFAHQFGLSLIAWRGLQERLTAALNTGVIDRVREQVIAQMSAQGSLFALR